MEVKFYGSDGSPRGNRDIDIPTFEGENGRQALKEVVAAYRANVRQGNACAKTRGDVRGSGKKPYRQKGTGMARHGEKRSPIWRKGGVVFGPKPRDFSLGVNRKVKRLALQRALFDRVCEQDLVLLEDFVSLASPRTASMAVLLGKIYDRGDVLVMDHGFHQNILLSMRNLERIFSVDVDSVNAWDLIRYRHVLVTERGMEILLKRVRL
ncbi:MAG: 50S ribosomal protein L4 [Puniceicoccales bacterium]|jgi:large subunit ribosomal protein L4|nr:50S ribosomal protein L4 [Puniceicoccales bacterium]